MSDPARLLFPAIRWDPTRGDWEAPEPLDRLLERGVGGFIVFGGRAAAVAELTARLRAGSPHPILVAADLERGAGQQFEGAIGLPPAAGLGSLGDPAVTRGAGALTGREAMALGVDWVYAPVADVDVEPENPIVGTRAFGADPGTAARHVKAWVEGCRGAGAATCAKHFPGHGRTTTDSHLGLPVVGASEDTLVGELEPFRAAVEAGVDAIMTAHVAYPSLDPDGGPATLSAPILGGLLRDRLGFDGVVVTDALTMAGIHGAGTSAAGPGAAAAVAVDAVAAGCDALLYPPDPELTRRALAEASERVLPGSRRAEAVARVRALAERQAAARRDAGAPGADRGKRAPPGPGAVDPVEPDGGAGVGRADDRAWALEVARRCVHRVRGRATPTGAFELVTVDADTGGPYPAPSRSTFPTTLRKGGLNPVAVEAVSGGRPAVVAVYASPRGFKGRAGLGHDARDAVRRAVAGAPSSLVMLFGHPRLADGIAGAEVACAWGGDAAMQEAAAVWLVEQNR